jgi:hypothetical protein
MEVIDKMEQCMHSHPPNIPQSYPWLVICDENHRERQNFFSISENHFYKRAISEMRNKTICTNINGWLLLKDLDSMDLCLLNLTSKEVVQLPRLDSINTDIDTCILSSPPSESNHDCHVMFIKKRSTFYFCQPGDKEFSEQEFQFNLDDRLMSIAAATMFRGKVHFLTWFSGTPPIYALFTAEFVGSNLHFTELTTEYLPRPSPPGLLTANDFLVESGDDLLYIHEMKTGCNFQMIHFFIFRMDFSRQVWVQVNNIGGWTIFLSRYCGIEHKAISCFATEKGIKQNSIYFTKPFDRFIYVFDLEDHGISKSLPCPIVSQYESRLDWVMIPTKKS